MLTHRLIVSLLVAVMLVALAAQFGLIQPF
jgi:hypothetical protein